MILALGTVGILVILFGIGVARYGSFNDYWYFQANPQYHISGQTYYPNLVPGLITIGMGAVILLVSLVALYKYHKVHKNDDKRYRVDSVNQQVV